MGSRVHTTIRYDGPALSGHDMDVQDLAPALLALADIVQATNRKFNGNDADIRVLVNADVEQRCFQIDIHLVQSVIEQATSFLSSDGVKSAGEIAKAIGIIGGGGVSLFKLITWMGKRPKDSGTKFQVKSDGGTVTIIDGDGNTTNVNYHVYQLASDPAIVDKVKKVIQPLQKPGYDTLSFVEGEAIIENITREEARQTSELPPTILDSSHEDVSIIRGQVRIKSPQYEGNAKWAVLWSGRAIDVTMDPEFVKAFQNNIVEAPPNTILDVSMAQTVFLDDNGRAVGSPSYTVVTIHRLMPPPKPVHQMDWLKDQS